MGYPQGPEIVPLGGPVVILVEPQMGENIGMVARAMLNCGLKELRLVRPRDGWPNERAVAACAGATIILDNVTLFDSLSDAIADCHYTYATSGKPASQSKHVVTARQAALETRAREAAGEKVALVFGPERTGLYIDDLSLCRCVLSVPLNPAFTSLNLSQAVLLCAYEWWLLADQTPPRELYMGKADPASEAEIGHLVKRLDHELTEAEYYPTPELTPHMRRSIRNIFLRMDLSNQDVRTLQGVISALVEGRKPHDKRVGYRGATNHT